MVLPAHPPLPERSALTPLCPPSAGTGARLERDARDGRLVVGRRLPVQALGRDAPPDAVRREHRRRRRLRHERPHQGASPCPLTGRARAVCFTADARRIPARPRLAALVGRVVGPERRQPGLQPLYGDGLEGHDQRRLPRRDRARPPRSSALARPIPALAPDDHPPSTGPALSATTSTPSAPARASRTTSSATTRPSETSSESVSARLSLLRFPSTAGADRCFSPRVATCSSVQRRRVRLHLFPVRSLPGQPTDAASLLSLCLCRVTCDSC